MRAYTNGPEGCSPFSLLTALPRPWPSSPLPQGPPSTSRAPFKSLARSSQGLAVQLSRPCAGGGLHPSLGPAWSLSTRALSTQAVSLSVSSGMADLCPVYCRKA